ncbi:MAG: SGNH/GDSL hydrolase family protein [Bacteroidetes bacterium]|nr:SGNH/GDSL hydrolase family protein [Bacteroidota bacterium]
METPSKKKKLNPFNIFILLVIGLIFTLHHFTFKDLSTAFLKLEKIEFLNFIFFRNIKLCILILLLFVLLFLFKKIGITGWKWYVLSVFISVFQLFYGIELYLSVMPPSQGNGEAFVSKLWFQKYWEVNNYKYRDRAFKIESVSNKNIILYVGDSYVAGHGIKKTSQRTPNLLELLLKNKYYIINGGRNGIGTRDEFKIIRNFPISPKLIILTHVSNDINDVKSESELNNRKNTSPSRLINFLYKNSRNSFFFDLIYIFKKNQSFFKNEQSESGIETKRFDYEYYKVDSLQKLHFNDLKTIVDYVTDSIKSKIVILTYPEGDDNTIDSSNFYINQKIASHFKDEKNVFIFNTTALFKRINQKGRVVNMFDGHPSAQMNKIIADSLFQFLVTKEILAP